MMQLIEKIDDLIKQATTERSHYYVASILKECKAALSDAQAVERELDQWRDLCMRQGVELKAKEGENGEKERTLTEQDETILHLQAALAAAQGDNGKLREVIETMILFIPDGWQMPLGWNQVVAQAQEAIGGKP